MVQLEKKGVWYKLHKVMTHLFFKVPNMTQRDRSGVSKIYIYIYYSKYLYKNNKKVPR